MGLKESRLSFSCIGSGITFTRSIENHWQLFKHKFLQEFQADKHILHVIG